ncbi:eukaryotic translation initiation factor 4E-1A isoform X1 [Ictalurus furcatus]|uniref:eukaryotic translation initiation factor 4E-1A isoform X1 n=1 Tax=Ictalurus furcatus TaxID=66913 RepID=UPI00234FEDD5|nr:eukaryotic translation initiation factor 4E-1A isoform X1 [Ictalurus furcatus]
MASEAGGETLSLRHGVRCVPENGEQVERVLLAVGEQVGCENIYSVSRMNKAVVVFLKKERLANTLSESGIWLKGVMLHVTPLSAPATWVVFSNVPAFVTNELMMKELARFGRFSSPMTDIPLGCKNSAVKHIRSFRRQVYMFINNREQTLDVNFKCKVGVSSYTVFATTERLRCSGCREIGHTRLSRPRRAVQPGSSGGDTAGVQQQQRGDRQRGNTGEQEPGADGGNHTPEPQLEEVSDEHNTTEINTTPSDSTDTRVHDSNNNNTADSTRSKPYTAITV